MLTRSNLLMSLLLGAAFGGMVAFSVRHYEEPTGPAIVDGVPMPGVKERVEYKKDPLALGACQTAAAAFIRNPATIDWDIWGATSTHLGGGRWSHTIPLTAQNDMGVAKSLTVRCQTAGVSVLGLQIE